MAFVFDRTTFYNALSFSEQPDKLEVFEIRPSHSSHELHGTQTPDANVGHWSTQNFLNETEAPALLRLMWVPMQYGPRGLILDTRKSSLDILLKNFELEEPYRYSFTWPTFFALMSAPQTEQSNTLVFSLCSPNNFGVAWKHNVTSGKTEGVFWMYGWAYKTLWRVIKKMKAWARHPLFLALAASVMLGDLLDDLLDGANHTINVVETRTRYHGFDDTTAEIAEGDFTSLSQRMSGCAGSLALIERDHKFLTKILDDISLYSQRYDGSDDPGLRKVRFEMEHCVETLKSKLKMQKIELDYLSRRVEIQLTAVSNAPFTAQLSILNPNAPC